MSKADDPGADDTEVGVEGGSACIDGQHLVNTTVPADPTQ
jgi:hypothetical protein